MFAQLAPLIGVGHPSPDLDRSLSEPNLQAERLTHTFGIADTVKILHRHTSARETVIDDLQSPCTMVESCVSRLKSFPGRRDVCVSDIRQNGG